jgi:hypothetical protein
MLVFINVCRELKLSKPSLTSPPLGIRAIQEAGARAIKPGLEWQESRAGVKEEFSGCALRRDRKIDTLHAIGDSNGYISRCATLRPMPSCFDLLKPLLWSRPSCAPASRATLCRNPGSRCMRIQPDHGVAMSCVGERNQTNKQESTSTSS